jgi:hypothetical protein
MLGQTDFFLRPLVVTTQDYKLGKVVFIEISTSQFDECPYVDAQSL